MENEQQPSSGKLWVTIGASVLVTGLVVGGAMFAYAKQQQNNANSTSSSLQAQIDKLNSDLAISRITPLPDVTPTPTATPLATPTPTTTPTTAPASTPTPTSTPVATPTPTPSSTIFKSPYFSVTVPSDWKATSARSSAEAVNITKGNYILYINTHASQVGGGFGGRFSEIAMGAPSADATITEWPTDPCLTPIYTPTTGNYLYSSRGDLYVDKTAPSWCNIPTTGTAWYFSYITGSKGYYFNQYTNTGNDALVITMAYNTSSVNNLPKKGDASLTAALDAMTSIASTLHIVGH